MDAKIFYALDFNVLIVSIHAPVMDANRQPNYYSGIPGFNPRARDGRE